MYMQMFGLISLLIVVAIGATLMVSSMGGSSVGTLDSEGNITKSIQQEAIDSAKDVVDKMEDRDAANSFQNGGASVAVYDGISVSENITVLNLSGRGLSGSLKTEVRMLTKLRELDLSNNNFTGLPAEIGQLSKLEVLNLSNNPFTGLPNELGNLKNLKVLDLRGTNYAEQDLAMIRQSLPTTTQILTN